MVLNRNLSDLSAAAREINDQPANAWRNRNAILNERDKIACEFKAREEKGALFGAALTAFANGQGKSLLRARLNHIGDRVHSRSGNADFIMQMRAG